MPKSRNQASEQMKRKQSRNKQNRIRELFGEPIIDKKFKKVRVREIKCKDRTERNEKNMLYWDPYQEMREIYAKISGLKNRGKDKYGYQITSIACPHCGKKIYWNKKWEAFVCDHDRPLHIYEAIKKDERSFVVASGGVVNTFREIYGDNAEAKDEAIEKTDEKEQMRRQLRKENPYSCPFKILKRTDHPKICDFRCSTYDRLLQHYKEKHGFRPTKERETAYDEYIYGIEQRRYVILKDGREFPIEVECPICGKDARLSLRKRKYVCKDGHKIQLLVAQKALSKKERDQRMEKNLLQNYLGENQSLYDLVKNARCSHCGGRMIITKDKENLYCIRRFGCPFVKAKILQRQKEQKRAEKPHQQEPPSLSTWRTQKLVEKKIKDWGENCWLEKLKRANYASAEKRTHITMVRIKNGKYTITEKPTEKRKENIKITISEKEKDVRPKTKIKCQKCGHDKAYWTIRQMRGSDEPESRFYECTKCGHKWRED